MPSERQTHESGQDTRARFIVIEGLDGAGTTTQSALLADALRARDLRVCLTAEPTDGPLGHVLRAHIRGEITLNPLTTALTFTADRADHLARTIRPALAAGEWVVCDRYLLSTLAYQGAEGIDRAWVLDASKDFEVPDLTLFLDVPFAALRARLATRESTERYEDGGLAATLHEGYLASIELLRNRGHAIEIVDGSREPAAVLETVKSQLDAIG